MVFVSLETAARTEQRLRSTNWLTAALVFACVAGWLCLSVLRMQGQSSPSQTPSQAPQTQPPEPGAESEQRHSRCTDRATVFGDASSTAGSEARRKEAGGKG